MIAVINFTPTHLVKEIGLQNSLACYATGIYFLGSIIFAPIAGKLADRWGPLPFLTLITGVACPLIFLVSKTHSIGVLPIYILLIGGSNGGAWPPPSMIIAEMSGHIGKGETFGYAMVVVAVTSSLSPLLLGIAADRIGLRLSIRAFTIPVVMSFILLLVLSRVYSLRMKASEKWYYFLD
ncbi:MAG: MFS transporter [Spirochaetota bacterium]|nr:MAG: MFS transporter [Spirochaetota bacterium]